MAHNIEAILTMKDNMSATLKVADSNMRKFGRSMQSQGRALRSFGTRLGYLGKDMMKLNAPFLAVGGWATKLGIDFEAVTSEAQAVMGATSSEMEIFKEKAKEVGGVTSKSAKESMEAMKLLAQSGMEQADILETVYPLVRLSEAGNLDMARSADLLTNSMKSAEVPIKNVGKYLDQITKSGNETNTSIEQQLEAWNSAGGSIASANMKMSETNALLGVLANRGVKGSEAGNTLSRVFQNLNATSGEAGKAMEKLGIKTSDSSGNMRNKIDVLKELKEKTDKMTEADREHYLTMIGGKAHTENLKKMLAGLGDEFDDIEKKIEDSNGALEKMAKIMKDNLKGKLETLSSSTETFGLKLADALIPRVEGVIDSVQGFVNALNKMDKEQLDTIIDIILFTTKLAGLLIIVGGVFDWIGKLKVNIGALAGAFAEGSVFSNIFGLAGFKLIAVFIAIGIAIALVVKHWDKIKKVALQAKDAISEFIEGNVDMDLVKEKIEGIKESFESAKESIAKIGEAFMDLLAFVGPILLELGKIIGGAILDNLPGVLEGIMTFVEGVVEFFSGLIQAIGGLLTGDFDMFLDGLNSMFDGAISILSGIWEGFVSLISMPVEAVIELLAARFPEQAESIKAIWETVKTFLKNPIKSTVQLASAIFMSGVNKVKSAWSGIKTFLSADAKGKVELISDAFHRGIDKARKAWEGFKNFVRNPIKGTINVARKGAEWVGSKIGNNWQGTNSWKGGATWLHEKGAEIFDLPGGTRVYPHDKSIETAYKDGQASVGKGNSVSIAKLADTIVVREEADIDRIADRLATKIEDVKFNMA